MEIPSLSAMKFEMHSFWFLILSFLSRTCNVKELLVSFLVLNRKKKPVDMSRFFLLIDARVQVSSLLFCHNIYKARSS